MNTAAIIEGCWITGEIGIGLIIVGIALWRHDRAKRDAEDERVTEGIKVLKAIAPAVDLANPLHVTPSPMLARRPTPRPTVQQRNLAALEQKRRHPAVVLATNAGPLQVRPPRARPVPIIPGETTQRFNRYVEEETGTPPAGRGPREADLRGRAVDSINRSRPAPAWEQDMLPIEVG